MNEELALADQIKPSAQPGLELQVQLITFNSNYGLFLNKSPLFLHTFESAIDAMLAFLLAIQSDDLQAQNKLKEYKDWMVTEETK